MHNIHHAVFFSSCHPLSHLFDTFALIACPIQVGFLREYFILLMQYVVHMILHLSLVPHLYGVHIIDVLQLLVL